MDFLIQIIFWIGFIIALAGGLLVTGQQINGYPGRYKAGSTPIIKLGLLIFFIGFIIILSIAGF